MRIATGQFTSSENKARNRDVIATLAERAHGERAQLLVLPEASMHPLLDAPGAFMSAAEDLDGPFVRHLRTLAADLDMTLVAGMFERIPDERHVYNTVVSVGPAGLLNSYRKVHLVDALGWYESTWVRPGEKRPRPFVVDGFTCGVVTCYDLRFPEIFRSLATQGADVLLVPAAWAAGPLKEDHWVTLLRARAIENTCYVVGAGQSGPRWSGRSLVADPMGVVLAGLGEVEGVVSVEISVPRLEETRRKLPVLSHRRFEVAGPAGVGDDNALTGTGPSIDV